MSVTVRLDGLDALVSESRDRQEAAAMRAALGMRRYVPRDENTLRASEPMNSRYAAGLLIWSTPYAQAQYSVPMRHTEPGTCDHWDEAWARNDMPSYLSFVASLYDKYG